MQIFMVTSVPLVPPWDHADKQLACSLVRALPAERFYILTVKDQPQPSGENLYPLPLYHSTQPSLAQKVAVYAQLPAFASASDQGRAPDLYHFVHRPYSLSSRLHRLLPEFRRRPTLHTLPASRDGQPLRRELFSTDVVVVLSEYARGVLADLGLRNVRVIPPGVDLEHWATVRAEQASLKAQLGLTGRPVVFFPGHFGPGSGASHLLHTLPVVLPELPDLALVFASRWQAAGDAEYEHELRRTAVQLGLQRFVFFLSGREQRALIGASDCVALPSESMRQLLDLPLALLEALAAGVPIITSDIAPLNELLSTDVGIAVPTGDTEALAHAISTLLGDTARRERMARRSVEVVRRRYSLSRVARCYQQLYRELTGALSQTRG